VILTDTLHAHEEHLRGRWLSDWLGHDKDQGGKAPIMKQEVVGLLCLAAVLNDSCQPKRRQDRVDIKVRYRFLSGS